MTQGGSFKGLRAVIVGLGRIAWGLDQGQPDAQGGALTHLASLRSRGIKVLAGVDPDPQTRTAFASSTAIAAVATLPEALALRPDLVCIASPNACHADQLTAVLAASVPYVWLEKPATLSFAHTQTLAHTARDTGARVLVGFQRRYLPVYTQLQNTDDLGPLQAIHVVYSRGLETNGIHMLDLVSAVVKDAPLRVVGVTPPPASVHVTEACPSFLLQTDDGLSIGFTGLDLDHHSIDITTHHAKGRRSVLYGGAAYHRECAGPNPLFPGFSRLFPDPQTGPTPEALAHQTRQVFPAMLDDLIAGTQPQPQSNLDSAAHGQHILETVLAQCAR